MVDNGHERQRCEGRGHSRILVKELKPGKRVAWKSPKGQGADEWEETEVTFDLSTDEKQTFIQFRHSGWRESTDFQGHRSMRWAVFLLSLKDVLERGKGVPIHTICRFTIGEGMEGPSRSREISGRGCAYARCPVPFYVEISKVRRFGTVGPDPFLPSNTTSTKEDAFRRPRSLFRDQPYSGAGIVSA